MSVIGRAVPFIVGSSGASGAAEAAAWAAAVTSAGGTSSAGTQTALATLIGAMKDAGVWPSKITFFNPVCGDQLAAARVQYKSTSGTWAQASVTSIVNADYTEATGIKGDGSSKFLDTGVTIAQMPGGGNSHLGFYGKGMETTGGNTSAMGAYGASPFPGYQLDTYSAGNGGRRYYSDSDATSPASAGTTTGLLADAYLVGSQTATNVTTMYQGGVSIATSSNTTGATISDTNTIRVLAVNGSFGAQWSAAACRGYHGGAGLTAQNVADLKAAWDTFNAALLRNV